MTDLRTTEELAKQMDQVGRSFDLIGDHVVVTDPEGAIVYANESVVRGTGFTLEEILGSNPGKVWGGHMPKEFYQRMWHTIKDEKDSFVGEVHNIKKDGTEYWQELRIYPVLDAQRNVVFYIGLEPDITARKQEELRLKERCAAFERLNAVMVNRELVIIALRKEVADLRDEVAKCKK
ncbi:MAG: PAS domain S-box protein [Patescibacteria group bacterium]|nr:PAS domain S-box protein [Patescibacteria group bacterium]